MRRTACVLLLAVCMASSACDNKAAEKMEHQRYEARVAYEQYKTDARDTISTMQAFLIVPSQEGADAATRAEAGFIRKYSEARAFGEGWEAKRYAEYPSYTHLLLGGTAPFQYGPKYTPGMGTPDMKELDQARKCLDSEAELIAAKAK